MLATIGGRHEGTCDATDSNGFTFSLGEITLQICGNIIVSSVQFSGPQCAQPRSSYSNRPKKNCLVNSESALSAWNSLWFNYLSRVLGVSHHPFGGVNSQIIDLCTET